MIHNLYVYANSGAEERLLYLFDKTNAKYSKAKWSTTIQGETVNLYMFDSVTYKAIKQYLQNEES